MIQKENSCTQENKDKHSNTKLFLQVLLFSGLFVGYLSLGAWAFSAFEAEIQDEIDYNSSQLVSKFSKKHPCCTEEELVNLLYDVTGVSYGHKFEQNFNHSGTRWRDFHDTFFFSATIVTTIGYGDMILQTNLGRWFCIIYACVGIPIAAVLISHIGTIFLKVWKGSFRFLINNLFKCQKEKKFLRLYKIATAVILLIITIGCLLIVPAIILTTTENWTASESFYFCFISLSTIGFGDYIIGENTKHHEKGEFPPMRYLAIAYLILGLSVLSAIFTSIAKYHTNKVDQVTQSLITKKFPPTVHEDFNNANNLYVDTFSIDSRGIIRSISYDLEVVDGFHRTDESFQCDKSTQTHHLDILRPLNFETI